MFTATKLQVATYLLGVCLFSISFLVFLNSSLSFVIADILHEKDIKGDAVGTLGFADELVALVACPAWGILSDRIGVRTVASIGYGIVGVSLIVFVQAKHVYPDLLLARMFFSVGGAATVTMVTAILPSMTASKPLYPERSAHARPNRTASSASSEPATPIAVAPDSTSGAIAAKSVAPSRLAGLVGTFTGCGALIALGVFLPMPTWFKRHDTSNAEALQAAFYVVGSIAFVVALICFVGLRHLRGEDAKSWRRLRLHKPSAGGEGDGNGSAYGSGGPQLLTYRQLLVSSLRAARRDRRIALAYLGGFVARASSVGITLFLPFFVNDYFRATGRCGRADTAPGAIQKQCRAAYVLAAQLTGISQLCALLCAPLFGFLADRASRTQAPLLVGAFAGVLGYTGLATRRSPLPRGPDGSPAIFVLVCLIGISQISAIVCSLGLLSRAIDRHGDAADAHTAVAGADAEAAAADDAVDDTSVGDENTALLPSSPAAATPPPSDLRALQGSIAGTYSLLGGAGILLLTKGGGLLFDAVAPGAPFALLAAFNVLLLASGMLFAVLSWRQSGVKNGVNT